MKIWFGLVKAFKSYRGYKPNGHDDDDDTDTDEDKNVQSKMYKRLLLGRLKKENRKKQR